MLQGYRVAIGVIVLLVLSSLACNLTRSDEADDSTQLVNNTAPPSLRIIEAPNTATVNQPINVEIEAAASTGNVTRVELLVNGLPVTQQSGTGVNPLRTTLSWTPLRQGDIQISVVAYQGVSASTPQTRSLTVTNAPTGNNDNDTGGGTDNNTNFTPSAPNQGPCRARMTTSLRLRSEPSTAGGGATIISVFNVGDEAPVVSRLADNSWFQVQNPATAQQGWVFYNNNDGQYFTLIGRCVSVPVSTPPATATLAPTLQPTATPTIPPVALEPPDIVAVPISGNTNLQLGAGGTAVGNYSLQVRNDGGNDTGTFQVLIVLPGGQERVRTIDNLAPGQAFNLADSGDQQQITFDAAGQRRISIFADFEDTVSESVEANNFEILDITITE